MNTFNIGGVTVTVTREPATAGNNAHAAAAATARELVALLEFATGAAGETPSGAEMWTAMASALGLARALRARIGG